MHGYNPSIWEDSECKSCLGYIGNPLKTSNATFLQGVGRAAKRQTMCVVCSMFEFLSLISNSQS